jgi:hypothetical protein
MTSRSSSSAMFSSAMLALSPIRLAIGGGVATLRSLQLEFVLQTRGRESVQSTRF